MKEPEYAKKEAKYLYVVR